MARFAIMPILYGHPIGGYTGIGSGRSLSFIYGGGRIPVRQGEGQCLSLLTGRVPAIIFRAEFRLGLGTESCASKGDYHEDP